MRLSIDRLVKDLRALPKYNPTKLIRLDICRAGDIEGARNAGKLCPAQILANKLRSNPVTANSDDANAFYGGKKGAETVFGGPDCSAPNARHQLRPEDTPTIGPLSPEARRSADNRPTLDEFGSTTAAGSAWESSWGRAAGWLTIGAMAFRVRTAKVCEPEDKLDLREAKRFG
jgi:hypothetical protein